MDTVMKSIQIVFRLLLLLTLITGVIYPAMVTITAQWLFPWQASGSLLKGATGIAGSAIIGQSFTDLGYFWGRPSATIPFPYNASLSMGSNYGPTNPDFFAAVKHRVEALRRADPHQMAPIPVDLVTASGSGLDPDISPYAARYQVSRIAKVRHVSPAVLESLIDQAMIARPLYVFGEPRVNVLQLNLALDEWLAHQGRRHA